MITIGQDMSFTEGGDRLCRFARASLECAHANGRLILSQDALDRVVDHATYHLYNVVDIIRRHANELCPPEVRRRIPNQEAVFQHLEEDLAYIDLTAINISQRPGISDDRKVRLIRDWLNDEFFPTYVQTAIDILRGEN